MDAIALHLELRNALALADELARHAHVLGNDTLAGYLSSIRTGLGELERNLGASHRRHGAGERDEVAPLQRSLLFLRERLEEVPTVLRPRLVHLMAALERIVFAELRPSAPVPAKLLFGGLPLARFLPQAVHSAIDYLAAAAYLASARLAHTPQARIVGGVLGAKVGGVALLTDCRLAAVRRIPIEQHEALDYALAISAVAAPFVLGYRKKDSLAAKIQIAVGLATILASLVTDYRAHRGVARSRRMMRSRPARPAPQNRRQAADFRSIRPTS